MTNKTQTQDITYSISASPAFAQDGVCFAARASGLYRSDDGGTSWRFTYDSLKLNTALPTLAVVVSIVFATGSSLATAAVIAPLLFTAWAYHKLRSGRNKRPPLF